MGDCPAMTALTEKQLLKTLSANRIVRLAGSFGGRYWLVPVHYSFREHCCRVEITLDPRCHPAFPALRDGQRVALEWEQDVCDGHLMVTGCGTVRVTPGDCPCESPTVEVRVGRMAGWLVAKHEPPCK